MAGAICDIENSSFGGLGARYVGTCLAARETRVAVVLDDFRESFWR